MINWLKKEKNIWRVFILGTVLLAAGCLLAAPRPVQARLDELIRPDAPYFAATEAPAEDDHARVAATPRIYIVRAGDTLGAIAAGHNVDVKQLAEMNNLRDYDHIVAGQVLVLPGTTFPYVVQKGENLGVIAARFGVDEEELAGMNNLRDPDHLLAGQSLMIPAGRGGGDAGVSRALPLKQLRWPVVGWISSPFGMRDGEMHHGLDIAADHGQVVRAAKGGRVVFCGPRGDYGNTVIIDHGGGLQTLYAHNSTLLVREGQKVLAGQPIARVGSTGRSTGPHVHLEVRLNGVPFDPMLCLERSYA